MTTANSSANASFELLSDGGLVLKLGEVCIQTAAKNAHRQLVQELLGGGAACCAREALVDMLAGFLDGTDFAALRAAHPLLAGGTPCRVKLHRDRDGVVLWKVIGSG
jgi:hypothetical protein